MALLVRHFFAACLFTGGLLAACGGSTSSGDGTSSSATASCGICTTNDECQSSCGSSAGHLFCCGYATATSTQGTCFLAGSSATSCPATPNSASADAGQSSSSSGGSGGGSGAGGTGIGFRRDGGRR